ncbi:MAG: ferredoxin--nitrite reductase [Epsilonproteobacteria bacterium]|nr:ferredoxin--nitrite reductase [Campylobacterota bacterium]
MQKIEEISKRRNAKVNKIEKIKSNRTIDEAMVVLKSYAKSGYDSIEKDDKAVFFKYFGLFDKEKSNGKNHFMLRVRIPGGQITAEQAIKVGEVAKVYGNNYMDITTRMQLELRYLKIEDVPTVLEELASVGITTYQTGIDNFRNIVTDPLDGLSFDNVLTAMPLVKKMQEVFLQKSEWIGTLPRKFNTAITGNYANRCNIFSHDCSFVLAEKAGVLGFNVYLGGRVGVIAKNANVFLSEDEVVPFFAALIEIFKEYGFRDNRNKNRLHFFIQEVGMSTLIDAIKVRSGLTLKSSGEQLVSLEHFDAKYGKVKLKDETYALHVVVPAGIFDGEALKEAGQIAQKYGQALRFSIDQNLYITGIKEEDLDEVLAQPLFSNYKNVNTPFYNHMISCAGSDTCSFGVIRGKVDALEMSEYLSQNIDLEDAKIRIYWSACVKGCGIHELGDIGLLGCKAKHEGETVPGVDIMLGGKLLGGSQDAKRVLKSVPLHFAKYYVEELVLLYKEFKKQNESFEKFYERVLEHYAPDAIGFLMQYNYLVAKKFQKPDQKITLSQMPKCQDVEVSQFKALLEEEKLETFEVVSSMLSDK